MFKAAKAAGKAWAKTPLWKRAEHLHKVAALMKDNAQVRPSGGEPRAAASPSASSPRLYPIAHIRELEMERVLTYACRGQHRPIQIPIPEQPAHNTGTTSNGITLLRRYPSTVYFLPSPV